MMSAGKRAYDMIILGASGFTGAYVVQELARVAAKLRHAGTHIRWAVAGRNEAKLQAALNTAGLETGDQQISKIDKIICDTKNEKSLKAMAAQSQIVLNCVGPYWFYGEPVVKACIETGSHHLDITGELQFIESMHLRYNEAAREKGVYVVHACGFDSIPAEMGLFYTEAEFRRAFGDGKGQLNAVEAFFSVKPSREGYVGNYGTYLSAIHAFANKDVLFQLQKHSKLPKLPKAQYRHPAIPPMTFNEQLKSYLFPFPGPDVVIVGKSQQILYDLYKRNPVQYLAYSQVKGKKTKMYKIGLFATVFRSLVKFSWARSLMEKYPKQFSNGLFSFEGPTKKQLDGTSFTMQFKGYGWKETSDKHGSAPDCVINTSIKGPEMGYVATPKALVQAGLTVLQEKEKLPPKGGVFTPGAAFHNTNLLKRLQDSDFVFTTHNAASKT